MSKICMIFNTIILILVTYIMFFFQCVELVQGFSMCLFPNPLFKCHQEGKVYTLGMFTGFDIFLARSQRQVNSVRDADNLWHREIHLVDLPIQFGLVLLSEKPIFSNILSSV